MTDDTFQYGWQRAAAHLVLHEAPGKYGGGYQF
jgi:hypothetical protein